MPGIIPPAWSEVKHPHHKMHRTTGKDTLKLVFTVIFCHDGAAANGSL
jgi:hypothetical protein